MAGLALATAVMAAFQLCDYDLYLHAAVGREIWRRGAPVAVELFSHTARGAPFTTQEWLFEAVVYAIHAAAGPIGLQAARVLLLAAVFAILLRRTLRAGARPCVALPLLVLGAMAARPVSLERPSLVTLAGLVALDGLIEAAATRARWQRLLVAAAALSCLWANAHAGILLAGPLLALAAIEEALRPRSLLGAGGDRRRGPLRVIALGAAFAAGAALTPSLSGGLLYPVRLLLTDPQPQIAYVEEWQPLVLSPRWGALIFLSVITMAVFAAAPRAGRWRTAAFGLAMFVLALRYRRNALMAAPFLAQAAAVHASALADRLARRVWKTPSPNAGRRFAAGGLAAALATGLTALALAQSDYLQRPGLGNNPLAYPVAVVRLARGLNLSGPIYNSYSLGGYLAFHAPELALFQHGENMAFAPVFRRLAAEPLERLFAEVHPVDVALVCYAPRELARVAAYFGQDRDHWAMVGWDDVAVLYLRRLPRHAPILQSREYVWLRVCDPLAPPSEEAAAGLLAELARARAEAPESLRARYLLGGLLAATGRPAEALAELDAARPKYGDLPDYRELRARVRREIEGISTPARSPGGR